MTAFVKFRVNGLPVEVETDPMRRLADVLRDDLGMTGTKIGCNAGDCGACTVQIDGRQACACLVPVAQVGGTNVRTVEGLHWVAGTGPRHDVDPGPPLEYADLGSLQRAFLAAGAAQCGICTPGMLMAADELLAANPAPSEPEVADALGGVLCRCTGYRGIIDAVVGAGGEAAATRPRTPAGHAVGARMTRVDGVELVAGTATYGADEPAGQFLVVRAVRSPHTRARFSIGDLG
ncbi:MAG: 2Fe-2S iron-sulfur cluster-binding protein, partial [Candidatus Limnocylindrales bacterium]